MKSIGEKIRSYRERLGISQSALARIADLSNDYMNKIELDKVENIGLKKLESIATGLGVNISDLFPKPESPIHEHTKTSQNAKRMIPIVGYANAGKNDNNIHWDDAGFPAGHGFGEVSSDDRVNDPNAYALEIKGDSMSPLDEGKWIVVVAPSWQIENDDLVVARLRDGDVVFKKISFNGQQYILKSFNPSHPLLILKKSDLTSLHRVVRIDQK